MTNEFKSRVCCLNIVGKDNELLNNSATPMIMYWDGNTNIEQDLKSNQEFLNLLYKNAFNLKHYRNTVITWVEYSFNEDNPDDPSSEHIKLNSRYIDHMFPLKYNKDISINIIFDIIYDMYLKAFNLETSDIDNKNKKENIVAMISKMFSFYKDKLTVRSVINHIRNKCQENNFNKDNIQEIITVANEFIN